MNRFHIAVTFAVLWAAGILGTGVVVMASAVP